MRAFGVKERGDEEKNIKKQRTAFVISDFYQQFRLKPDAILAFLFHWPTTIHFSYLFLSVFEHI